MNDPRKIELVFLLDRNDISVAAHGYQRILKIFLIIGIMQDLFQLLAHTVFRYLDAGPQSAQLGRSAVLDFAFFRNSIFQLFFQTRQRLQSFGIASQSRRQLVLLLQKGLDLADRRGRTADLHQGFCFQHRP